MTVLQREVGDWTGCRLDNNLTLSMVKEDRQLDYVINKLKKVVSHSVEVEMLVLTPFNNPSTSRCNCCAHGIHAVSGTGYLHKC